MTPEACRIAYSKFLSDTSAFISAMVMVQDAWPNSCEHFLTNPAINRIAWLGQAAMCITTGVSSMFCGGFRLLTPQQQRAANACAASFLADWEIDYEHRKNKSVHREMETMRLF